MRRGGASGAAARLPNLSFQSKEITHMRDNRSRRGSRHVWAVLWLLAGFLAVSANAQTGYWHTSLGAMVVKNDMQPKRATAPKPTDFGTRRSIRKAPGSRTGWRSRSATRTTRRSSVSTCVMSRTTIRVVAPARAAASPPTIGGLQRNEAAMPCWRPIPAC